MTDNQKILCHAYVTVVFKPFYADKYKTDLWESYDDERIRIHGELCESVGLDKKIIAELLDKAGWMFGVDPFTDPYFDITTVSDKFVELIENEIQERQEKENGH